MGSMPIAEWIAVAIGLISSAFYGFVLTTIIAERKRSLYKSFFYKLFVAQGFLNIGFYLTASVLVRARKYRLLVPLDALLQKYSTGFVPAFIIAYLAFVRLALYFATLVFAVNRFTAFVTPHRYNTMWKNWHILLIFIIQLLLLLPVLYINYGCGTYVYVVISSDLAVFVPTKELQKLHALFNILSAGVTVIIISFLYLSIYVCLRIRVTPLLTSFKAAVEIRFLLTCLFPFAVLVLIAALDGYAYVTTHYDQHDFLSFYSDAWIVLTDAMCLVHPFALFSTCSTVRDSIFRKKNEIGAWCTTAVTHR